MSYWEIGILLCMTSSPRLEEIKSNDYRGQGPVNESRRTYGIPIPQLSSSYSQYKYDIPVNRLQSELNDLYFSDSFLQKSRFIGF
jgi:hypothetical protein